MRGLLILTVALMLGSSCGRHDASQSNNPVVNQTAQEVSATPTPVATKNDSEKSDKKKDVPPAFSNVDFRNFAYPISWKHRTIPLKDGRAEYFQDKYLGNGWFDFGNVEYVDLTGDGKKNAVVELFWVSCGGSCDGGSHLFYFYSVNHGRLNLLSRIESGSLGYGECGLRSFFLEKKRLVLETFHVCRFDGTSIKIAPDPHPNPNAQLGKFMADKFTRFTLEFRVRRFRLTKREVLSNPQEDILNYPAKVTISND